MGALSLARVAGPGRQRLHRAVVAATVNSVRHSTPQAQWCSAPKAERAFYDVVRGIIDWFFRLNVRVTSSVFHS